MICGKCKIILVSKISIWPCRKDKNKNKNRTRASLFQSSEDGKQKIFYVALVPLVSRKSQWRKSGYINMYHRYMHWYFSLCITTYFLSLVRVNLAVVQGKSSQAKWEFHLLHNFTLCHDILISRFSSPSVRVWGPST